jgi:hypothetical protein
VFCNESRFERTPLESVISVAIGGSPFLGFTQDYLAHPVLG